MINPPLPPPPAHAPRPWVLRRPGECAFPVDGAGEALRCCGAPARRNGYCPAHARLMRRAAPSAAAFERDVLAFLERRQGRP